ncbi:hypothetical protein BH23CHL7_BH23CHL7_07100 [soil metagenome]
MAQAALAEAALEASAGASCELVKIVTQGDQRALDTAWGEGAFVGALEQALLEGRIDVAVHSAKDMPTGEQDRLSVIAYLPRADARDALVLRDGGPAALADLPDGSTIGTDSPRRAGFLRARRPDLQIRPLHGNVDTRLRRLDAGEVDALVLAAAGLERLGRADRISQLFDAGELPPAPGQGAIALQARAGDRSALALGATVDHPPTRLAVETERAFLAATGGGCRAPVGALAAVDDGELRLVAGFATLDGRSSAFESGASAPAQAHELAAQLAARLVSRRAAMADRGRVLITRPGGQVARLAARLAEHGLRAEVVPAIAIEEAADPRPLEIELGRLDAYSWAVVTSVNGARAAVEAARRRGIDLRAGRWAAVGAATTAVLREAGIENPWQPDQPRGVALGEQLPLGERRAVLLLRGSLADDNLPNALRERGAEVRSVVGYRTVEAPEPSRPLLERALSEGPISALLMASPSAVRGLLALGGTRWRATLVGLPAVCIGPTTGAAAREHGFTRIVLAHEQDASALADLAAELVAGSAVVSS